MTRDVESATFVATCLETHIRKLSFFLVCELLPRYCDTMTLSCVQACMVELATHRSNVGAADTGTRAGAGADGMEAWSECPTCKQDFTV